MNYYLDTKFLEGTQKKLFGRTKPTIDLISIGIVAEDGREYYAISKDFNLKEAWNRNDLDPNHKRNYKQKDNFWIRENVLKPIYNELLSKSMQDDKFVSNYFFTSVSGFTYHHMKTLIKWYGKSNKQIASEVIEFCKHIYRGYSLDMPDRHAIGSVYYSVSPIDPKEIERYDLKHLFKNTNPVFHTYYGAYDHVVFCWLFGRMIDLPKGFLMYSRDLKQMLDDKLERTTLEYHGGDFKIDTLEGKLKIIKARVDYPTKQNIHNALSDARWNKQLHEFIKSL